MSEPPAWTAPDEDPTGAGPGPAQAPSGWGPVAPPWGAQQPWSAQQPSSPQQPWSAQQPSSPQQPWSVQGGGAAAPGGGWHGRGSGIVPLRPLSVGEIYDGAIRAIRANPRTMVGFSAIVIAAITLIGTAPQALVLSTWLSSPLSDSSRLDNVKLADVAGVIGAGGLAVLVGALQFVLATTIVSGLLIVAVDEAVRGRVVQPGQLWSRCRRRLPRLLGLALLVPLALPVVVAVAILPGLAVVFVPHLAVLGVILLVLGVIGGLLGFVALYLGFWAVAAPCLLLEELGVLAALRRSARLVRGSFWRVLGIGLLTAVIAYVVRQVFTLPFGVIGGLIGAANGSRHFSGALGQLLVTDIGTILAGAVLYPFTAGVAALLYLDLRMRREGLDVEELRS